VILAGLLLGGVLAHFFGGSNAPQRPAQTPLGEASVPPVTPLPSAPSMASATPSPMATPTPTPPPTESPAPTKKPAKPTPTPTPSAAPVPSATPTRAPAPIATAIRKTLVATARPIAVATPVPAAPPKAPAGDPAASLVRSYLEALAHGDRATASTYLASGSASETFMSGEAQIESIRSTPQSNSNYLVTADVKSGGVEYYATFTVAPGPGGLQITDHYWIKPQ
jgi:outer membrane biosynthesis protein TonB